MRSAYATPSRRHARGASRRSAGCVSITSPCARTRAMCGRLIDLFRAAEPHEEVRMRAQASRSDRSDVGRGALSPPYIGTRSSPSASQSPAACARRDAGGSPDGGTRRRCGRGAWRPLVCAEPEREEPLPEANRPRLRVEVTPREGVMTGDSCTSRSAPTRCSATTSRCRSRRSRCSRPRQARASSHRAMGVRRTSSTSTCSRSSPASTRSPALRLRVDRRWHGRQRDDGARSGARAERARQRARRAAEARDAARRRHAGRLHARLGPRRARRRAF